MIPLPSLARAVALAVLAVPLVSLPVLSQTPAPAETPRLSNGKPDLSGMWGGGGGGDVDGGGGIPGFTDRKEDDGDLVRLFPSRRCAPNQLGCRDNTNQANDYEFTFRTYTNKPQYKPEHWDRVQFLDYDLNFSDPSFRCLPAGVPRMGAPRKIVQTADEVVFLYGGTHRVIPTDGRAHDENAFPTFLGDSVGHWEGDTLVIDVVSRNGTTWLGSHGYFHSFNLHVVERLRREGNTLHYQATVMDPDVLLQPWVMEPRVMRLNTNPKARMGEALPCLDFDKDMTVSRIRH